MYESIAKVLEMLIDIADKREPGLSKLMIRSLILAVISVALVTSIVSWCFGAYLIIGWFWK